jgi:hypothetical protein
MFRQVNKLSITVAFLIIAFTSAIAFLSLRVAKTYELDTRTLILENRVQSLEFQINMQKQLDLERHATLDKLLELYRLQQEQKK